MSRDRVMATSRAEALRQLVDEYGGDTDALLVDLKQIECELGASAVSPFVHSDVTGPGVPETVLMEQRFGRNQILFGAEHCSKLRNASVCVIGIGGVGSWTVEALARAGVGRLVLIDFCCVSRQNISRQICALEHTVGTPKVAVMQQRLQEINPSIRVEALHMKLTVDNAAAMLDERGPFECVVDAFDETAVKAELIVQCQRRGVPCIVSSLGAATRMDPNRMQIADISATTSCPLAKALRKQLRTREVTSGVVCLYSVEDPRNKRMTSRPHMIAQGQKLSEAHEGGGEVPHWVPSPMGSWVALPAIFGVAAAQVCVCSMAPEGTDAHALWKRQSTPPPAEPIRRRKKSSGAAESIS